MRPGRGLKVQGGLGPYQAHTTSQTVGGKAPTFADPKASSTAESGKGAPRRGSTTCGLFPCEAKRSEAKKNPNDKNHHCEVPYALRKKKREKSAVGNARLV